MENADGTTGGYPVLNVNSSTMNLAVNCLINIRTNGFKRLPPFHTPKATKTYGETSNIHRENITPPPTTCFSMNRIKSDAQNTSSTFPLTIRQEKPTNTVRKNNRKRSGNRYRILLLEHTSRMTNVTLSIYSMPICTTACCGVIITPEKPQPTQVHAPISNR